MEHTGCFSLLCVRGLLGLCPLRGGGAGRGANAGYFSPSYHRGLADADILQLKGKSQRCYFKQSISPLLCWQSQKQCQQQNHVLKATEAFLAIAMVLWHSETWSISSCSKHPWRRTRILRSDRSEWKRLKHVLADSEEPHLPSGSRPPVVGIGSQTPRTLVNRVLNLSTSLGTFIPTVCTTKSGH